MIATQYQNNRDFINSPIPPQNFAQDNNNTFNSQKQRSTSHLGAYSNQNQNISHMILSDKLQKSSSLQNFQQNQLFDQQRFSQQQNYKQQQFQWKPQNQQLSYANKPVIQNNNHYNTQMDQCQIIQKLENQVKQLQESLKIEQQCHQDTKNQLEKLLKNQVHHDQQINNQTRNCQNQNKQTLQTIQEIEQNTQQNFQNEMKINIENKCSQHVKNLNFNNVESYSHNDNNNQNQNNSTQYNKFDQQKYTYKLRSSSYTTNYQNFGTPVKDKKQEMKNNKYNLPCTSLSTSPILKMNLRSSIGQFQKQYMSEPQIQNSNQNNNNNQSQTFPQISSFSEFTSELL